MESAPTKILLGVDNEMGEIYRTARERIDLRVPGREDIRITCVTAGMETYHDHLYMETPVFSGDGNRFIFREPPADYLDGYTSMARDAMAAAYWLCDIGDGYACFKVCGEPGVKGGSMDYRGEYFYYICEVVGVPRVELKRMHIQTLKKETISVIDKPPSGCVAVPSLFYPIAAVRRDGGKYCTGAYLANSDYENGPWGVLVFDTASGELDIILEGEDYCNPHPQYAKNAEMQNDLLIQHNHGSFIKRDFTIAPLVSGFGADIHVIRDDGSDMRSLPWGRDGYEFCQGHQCWRGEMKSAVTSTSTVTGEPNAKPIYTLVESEPIRRAENVRHNGARLCEAGASGPRSDGAGERDAIADCACDVSTGVNAGDTLAEGRNADDARLFGERSCDAGTGGAFRRMLSAGIDKPGFVHFAISLDGQKFVSDFVSQELGARDPRGVSIVISRIRDGESVPLRGMTEICKTLTAWDGSQMSHPHPFFSPDTKKVLFNSYIGGGPQIHIAEGFDFDAI